jgi:hypothetical protein
MSVLRVIIVPFKVISILFNQLLNWFKTLRIRYNGSPEKLKKAVLKAETLHKTRKKRYRVYFLGGRYQTLTRLDVQRKKTRGEWKRRVNMTRLEPMEYYDTENGYSDEGNKIINSPRRH